MGRGGLRSVCLLAGGLEFPLHLVSLVDTIRPSRHIRVRSRVKIRVRSGLRDGVTRPPAL